MLHHIEIYVSKLQESKEFWGWFLTRLGYERFQEWESGISWRFDSSYLVFVQAKEKYLDVPYHRGRVGINHLAFLAKSKEQVDEITQLLKQKGIHILYKERHPYAGGPNHYAVYFEDPDRMKVELVAPA